MAKAAQPGRTLPIAGRPSPCLGFDADIGRVFLDGRSVICCTGDGAQNSMSENALERQLHDAGRFEGGMSRRRQIPRRAERLHHLRNNFQTRINAREKSFFQATEKAAQFASNVLVCTTSHRKIRHACRGARLMRCASIEEPGLPNDCVTDLQILFQPCVFRLPG